MALLRYEDLRHHDDPGQALLDFLQSGYEAAADLAQWDRDALETAKFPCEVAKRLTE